MVDRSVLYPTIDDIVFRVAVSYKNLSRSGLSKIDARKIPREKREGFVARSGVGYCGVSDIDVTIYLALQPYIIKVDGNHYLFDGVPVGRNFHLRRGKIAFEGEPMVRKEKRYHHPFVYGDNEICYAGDSRWRRPDINVGWGVWYDMGSKSTTFKIAKWLEEGRISLQEGYLKGVQPVTSLSRDSFSSEYRTPLDAKLSGVRIIENR